jgi:hypothetical protein
MSQRRTKMNRTEQIVFVLSLALMLGACGGQKKPEEGSSPSTAMAPEVFVERTYTMVPRDLGINPRDSSWDVVAVEPTNDLAITWTRVIVRAEGRVPKKLRFKVIGPPLLTDPKAPDPKVQKTCNPEEWQNIPRGHDCLFWFSPYLQFTLRWDYQKVSGSTQPHALVSGSWYRKTYAHQ